MPLAAIPDETKAGLPADDIIAKRADAVRSDMAFRERVGEAMSRRYADREPAAYIEQRIYDGFPGRADQVLMEQFQNADYRGRVEIAGRFTDERIGEYAQRLIYMEAPEMLSDGVRTSMDSWLRDRLLTNDVTVPWNTIPKAIRNARDLLADAKGNDATLLTEVCRFLEATADR
jgi:exodeoxyribonuclease-1